MTLKFFAYSCFQINFLSHEPIILSLNIQLFFMKNNKAYCEEIQNKYQV